MYKRQALADYPHVVSAFITAAAEDRIASLMKLYNVDAAKAKDIMVKTDKKRASYYNYYSSKKWGDTRSYDLCVNRSAIGIDGAVKLIRDFAEIKEAWTNSRH